LENIKNKKLNYIDNKVEIIPKIPKNNLLLAINFRLDV
tara:strand:+ start:1657 stop:1770 length:114 start_codon:yes stop_codon:yes gene_type:complete